MTERRRRHHAAAASRVLVAGVSTAAAFAMVASLASAPDATAAAPHDPVTATEPRRDEPTRRPSSTASAELSRPGVVAVSPDRTGAVRDQPPTAPASTPPSAPSPAPSSAPPVASPKPAPATATPAPVTRSDGS